MTETVNIKNISTALFVLPYLDVKTGKVKSFTLMPQCVAKVAKDIGERQAMHLPNQIQVVDNSFDAVPDLTSFDSEAEAEKEIKTAKKIKNDSSAELKKQIDEAVSDKLKTFLENYILTPKTSGGNGYTETEVATLRNEAIALGIDVKGTWGVKKLNEMIEGAKTSKEMIEGAKTETQND